MAAVLLKFAKLAQRKEDLVVLIPIQQVWARLLKLEPRMDILHVVV